MCSWLMPLTPAADEISDFLKNLLIKNQETVSQNYGIVLLQRNDDTSLLSLNYDFWNLWTLSILYLQI